MRNAHSSGGLSDTHCVPDGCGNRGDALAIASSVIPPGALALRQRGEFPMTDHSMMKLGRVRATQNPHIQPVARHGMSLISAVTARGHMRFMIIDKGSVNADVFIEFLKRLIRGAEREIFLIFDHASTHRARKASAFVQTLGRKLRLLFLPPHAPDRNPGELVWKHLKADTVGRMAVTSKGDFARRVRRAMRNLQNNTRKIRSFFQKPSLKYAA
jgi:transposase